ncbi:substrate-binding domain-containing protein [Paraburkholderia haematera]|uniref:substrate-binding domain-containing protein n=1 Tax=Paraburkholderia haematera TaxID=2793077 RepID=UPI001B8BC22B|nr:substrate-binding domain-containing protein [Paraburkholderia haematera]
MLTGGRYQLGVQGSLPDIAPEFVAQMIFSVELIPVSTPQSVCVRRGAVTRDVLRDWAQIVLTDLTDMSSRRTFFVLSTNQISTTDFSSKHAMLRAGLGWGFMPRELVADDLASGPLVKLNLYEIDPRSANMPLFLIHLRDTAIGPTAQWMSDSILGLLPP